MENMGSHDIIGLIASVVSVLILITKTDFLYIKSYFQLQKDKKIKDIFAIDRFTFNLVSKGHANQPKLTSVYEITSAYSDYIKNNNKYKRKIYYCCIDSKPIIKFNNNFCDNLYNDGLNRFWINVPEPLNQYQIKSAILISHQVLTNEDLYSPNIKYFYIGSIETDRNKTWREKLCCFLNCNATSSYSKQIDISWIQMALKYLKLQNNAYIKIIKLNETKQKIINFLNPLYWDSDPHRNTKIIYIITISVLLGILIGVYTHSLLY